MTQGLQGKVAVIAGAGVKVSNAEANFSVSISRQSASIQSGPVEQREGI